MNDSIKIIDSFIFYNEVSLLEYRLNILDEVVDYFVIVESSVTFTGKSKKLYYFENKKLFEKYSHKIIHVIVEDIPFIENPLKEQVWKNEKFQRNCISRGLDSLILNKKDIIIFSDVDEIPDPTTLELLKESNIDSIYALEQDFYYYSLNNMMSNKWYYSKITTYENYKISGLSIDQIRWSNFNFIKQGGWHLSYFGSPDFISNKIKNFSHQEYNTPEFTNTSVISERVKNGVDLFLRSDTQLQKIPLHLNKYLPPKYSEINKILKTVVIGFCSSGHLCERGTTVAMYDYAYYNKLYGNESIIFYDKNHKSNNISVISKFKKEFEVYSYDSFEEIDKYELDYFYNIKATNDSCQLTRFKNLSHIVFEINENIPSLNEIVTPVSQWVKGSKNMECVPHMINLPTGNNENLRNELGIPESSIVFGRHGGYDTFNIPFVHEAIKEILEKRDDIYFIFVNTYYFYIHKRIIYLRPIIENSEKVKFINTCDSMIHARLEGESFGLSIAEFSSLNKPVITTTSKVDNAHIELLGEKGILYNSKESLIHILLNFQKVNYLNRDWNAYREYTPEKVMEKFFSVFNIGTNVGTNVGTNGISVYEKTYNSMLNNPVIKNSSNDEVTIVTAFYDIGRGNWGNMKRSIEYYINSFKNYLNLRYSMIVFIDSRCINFINVELLKNVILIPIDEDFLNKNVYAWKNIEKARTIMNSEFYKKLLIKRINNGNPENIYPEYNCINHAKIDFIKYAVPFIKTSFVCWSDFGYHFSVFNNNSSKFPTNILNIKFFNTSKINCCLVNKIEEYDSISILQNAPDIFSGGFYGLPIKLVNPFQELYHSCLDELYSMNISDDDQHVLLKCYYKKPELFELYLSEDGKWPEALTYFQKRNNYLFVITSVVNVKCRSIYNSEERYNQTLITIKTIKKHVINANIVVVELSKDIVFDDVTMFYITDLPDVVYYDKTLGESLILKTFFNSDVFRSIDTDYIFKISGRYYLNDLFNMNNFNLNEFNSNKTLMNEECYSTCFFGIPPSKINILLNNLDNIISNPYNGDIEHRLFKNTYVNNVNMGVSGNIAPTGQLINY